MERHGGAPCYPRWTYYREVVLPHLHKRRPSRRERADVVTLWADEIQRCTSGQHALLLSNDSRHAVTSSSASLSSYSNEKMNLFLCKTFFLNKTPQDAHDSTPIGTMSDDDLEVFTRFLRYVTLPNIVDKIILSDELLSPQEKGIVAYVGILCAARLSSVLPTVDQRMTSTTSKRRLPFGFLQEVEDSSDDDRDFGAPRTIDDLIQTMMELGASLWNLAVEYGVYRGVSASVTHDTAYRAGLLCESVKIAMLRMLQYDEGNAGGPMKIRCFSSTGRSCSGLVSALCVVLFKFVVEFHSRHSVDDPRYAPVKLHDIGGADLLTSARGASSLDSLYNVLRSHVLLVSEYNDLHHIGEWAEFLANSGGDEALRTALGALRMISNSCLTRKVIAVTCVGEKQSQPVMVSMVHCHSPPLTAAVKLTIVEVLELAIERQLTDGSKVDALYSHWFPTLPSTSAATTSIEGMICSLGKLVSSEYFHRSSIVVDEVELRRLLSIDELTAAATNAHLTDDKRRHRHRYGRDQLTLQVKSSLPTDLFESPYVGPIPTTYNLRRHRALVAYDDPVEAAVVRGVQQHQVKDLEQFAHMDLHHTMIMSLLLRCVRLEWHRREEWLRLEQHLFAKLCSSLVVGIEEIFESERHRLAIETMHTMDLIDVESDEALRRKVAVEQSEEAARISLAFAVKTLSARAVQEEAVRVSVIERCDRVGREEQHHRHRAAAQYHAMLLEVTAAEEADRRLLVDHEELWTRLRHECEAAEEANRMVLEIMSRQAWEGALKDFMSRIAVGLPCVALRRHKRSGVRFSSMELERAIAYGSLQCAIHPQDATAASLLRSLLSPFEEWLEMASAAAVVRHDIANEEHDEFQRLWEQNFVPLYLQSSLDSCATLKSRLFNDFFLSASVVTVDNVHLLETQRRGVLLLEEESMRRTQLTNSSAWECLQFMEQVCRKLAALSTREASQRNIVDKAEADAWGTLVKTVKFHKPRRLPHHDDTAASAALFSRQIFLPKVPTKDTYLFRYRAACLAARSLLDVEEPTARAHLEEEHSSATQALFAKVKMLLDESRRWVVQPTPSPDPCPRHSYSLMPTLSFKRHSSPSPLLSNSSGELLHAAAAHTKASPTHSSRSASPAGLSSVAQLSVDNQTASQPSSIVDVSLLSLVLDTMGMTSVSMTMLTNFQRCHSAELGVGHIYREHSSDDGGKASPLAPHRPPSSAAMISPTNTLGGRTKRSYIRTIGQRPQSAPSQRSPFTSKK